MSKYREPWEYQERDCYQRGIECRILRQHEEPGYLEPVIDFDGIIDDWLQCEHYARIVACINACAGAENLQDGEMARLRAENERLKKEAGQ